MSADPRPETPLAVTACPLLLLIPLGIALSSFSDSDPAPRRRGTETEPRVRIALIESAREVKLQLVGAWWIESDQGSSTQLKDPGEVTLRWAGGSSGGLVLDAGEGSVGMPDAREVWVRPLSEWSETGEGSAFGLDGRRYRGTLRVRALPEEGHSLRAINSVGIEDYLAGVIGHEMPLRWSDEALHAQAIAARTYALKSLHPEKDHDLKADTRSQVYRGLMAEDARARKLVEDTRGQVVTHEGEMVVTYFHSTCGGDTVPAEWIFPWVDEASEPLSGATDCTCQSSKVYRWTKEIDLGEKGAWSEHFDPPLAGVSVSHWPRGQYVREVIFTPTSGESTTLTGWDTRRVFGLRGYAFDVVLSNEGRTLTFEGRGWGHGVGLCQYGADGFAKQGKDARWILGHFYPGTKVENLGY